MTQIEDNINSIDWPDEITRKFMLALNSELEIKLESNIISIANGPVFEYENDEYEVRTHRFKNQWAVHAEESFGKSGETIIIDEEMLAYISVELAAELETLGEFHAFMLAIGSVVLDPATFQPIAVFSTRYALKKIRR